MSFCEISDGVWLRDIDAARRSRRNENPDRVVLAGSRGASRLTWTESDAVRAPHFSHLSESAGPVTNRRPRNFSISCPRQPDGKMKCQVNVTRLECALNGVIRICSWLMTPKGRPTSSVSFRCGRMSRTSKVMRYMPVRKTMIAHVHCEQQLGPGRAE